MTNIRKIAEALDFNMPQFTRDLMDFMSDLPEHKTLTQAQAFLLCQIGLKGECSASTVAKMLGITSGPVTTMTTRLVEHGYLHRRHDETDKRVVLFSLTDKGKETLHSLVEHRKEKWALILQDLGEEKSCCLLSLVKEIQGLLAGYNCLRRKGTKE